MTEKLLQFIWRFQYFNRAQLQTTTGEPLLVVSPGTLNTHQGPDFLEARVRIGTTLLAGSIELHVKSSQWDQHGHSDDPNYKNVILHVVLENDRKEQGTIPVLELRDRISHLLTHRYEMLMQSAGFVPCERTLSTVRPLIWASLKDRMVAERLTRKTEQVFGFLNQNNFHWEETFWWMLARNFGIKVNTDAFQAIAQSIPVNLLAKHKNSIHQLEALLLGQAGLLNKTFEGQYPKLLQREYRFLSVKYGLKPVGIPVHFLRMRPGNFPTVRLAQLAMLVYTSSHLFSRVLETNTIQEVFHMFQVTANDYWHYHYIPDEPSGFKVKQLGKEMASNIIINTLAPCLFAYGLYHKEEKYKAKALHWLEQLEAEMNQITRTFKSLGVDLRSAFDSQALLELKKSYCDERHCLKCAIGASLLKTDGNN
jgi:Protein of unknown function (DUF2851)